jgi:hypothetical protein
METITDKLFTEDAIIDVDGKTFLRCTFDRCTSRFHGHATFATVECSIGVGRRLLSLRRCHAVREAALKPPG